MPILLILVINQFVYIRNRQAASEKMSTGHFLPSFRQALTCSKLGNFLFDFRHLDNKKDLKQSFKSYLVQMAGIEPARFIQPQDFKSCASASSATSAFLTGKNDYTTLLY